MREHVGLARERPTRPSAFVGAGFMFEDLNWLPQRGTLAGMGRLVTLVVGAVLMLLGLVWILQGLNIIGTPG